MALPLIPVLLVGGAALAAGLSRKSANPLPPPRNTRTYVLDENIPAGVRDYILNVLAEPRPDPAELDRFATELERKNYPMSAAAVRWRAGDVRAQWPAWMSPPSLASLSSPQAGAPQAGTPVSLPLDPSHFMGMPTDSSSGVMPEALQNEVAEALVAERDPAKLRQFASYLVAQYPHVAQLLTDRANALQSTTAGGQTVPVSWPPNAPSAVAPIATPTPTTSAPITSAAERNAGRPTGYPFILLRGEATYPARIAQQATGSEGNYPELSKLNPQFVHDGTHWMDIRAGDEINIPWAWAPKLNRLYDIQVDHGVVPPPDAIPAVPVAARVEPTVQPPVSPPTAPLAGPPSVVTPAPASLASTAAPPASAPPVNATGVLVSTSTAGPRHTYKVLKGDFPVKIAQKLVGDGNRWRELVSANPQKKTQADGNFASLQPNETLFLPDSWAPASVAPAGGAHAANA